MGPQLYRCGNIVTWLTSSSMGTVLQWGRNFIVAETRHRSLDALRGDPRFNGAATLSLRKHVLGAGGVEQGILASMGPQLYRCGNIVTWLTSSSMGTVLQWGRNFIVAETRHRSLDALRGDPRFNGAATLSLRKHVLGAGGVEQGILASMGPQLYRCGNLMSSGCPRCRPACFNGAATLSLRKLDVIWMPAMSASMLQWGRNFIVAETRHRSLDALRGDPRFNGAATLSLRKLDVIWMPAMSASMLQWAATLSLRKPCQDRGSRTGTQMLQWGPQLYRCGNLMSSGCPRCRPACFNGAATLSLRKPCQDRGSRTGTQMLQWGRNFIVAET